MNTMGDNHICACSAYDTKDDENLKKKHSILNLSVKFSVKNRESYQTSVTTHSQVVCANVETVLNTTSFCSQIIRRKFNCYFHFEIFSVKLQPRDILVRRKIDIISFQFRRSHRMPF